MNREEIKHKAMKAKIIKKCSICGRNVIKIEHKEYFEKYILCRLCEYHYEQFRESEDVLKIFIKAGQESIRKGLELEGKE